jgi:hypothetical protein
MVLPARRPEQPRQGCRCSVLVSRGRAMPSSGGTVAVPVHPPEAAHRRSPSVPRRSPSAYRSRVQAGPLRLARTEQGNGLGDVAEPRSADASGMICWTACSACATGPPRRVDVVQLDLVEELAYASWSPACGASGRPPRAAASRRGCVRVCRHRRCPRPRGAPRGRTNVSTRGGGRQAPR